VAVFSPVSDPEIELIWFVKICMSQNIRCLWRKWEWLLQSRQR